MEHIQIVLKIAAMMCFVIVMGIASIGEIVYQHPALQMEHSQVVIETVAMIL